MLHSSWCQLRRAMSASIATWAYPGTFPRVLCYLPPAHGIPAGYPHSARRVMAPTLGGYLFVAGTRRGGRRSTEHAPGCGVRCVYAPSNNTRPTRNRNRKNTPSLVRGRSTFKSTERILSRKHPTPNTLLLYCRLTCLTFDI